MEYLKEITICYICCVCTVLGSLEHKLDKTHFPGIRYMEEECNHTDLTATDMRLQLVFDTDIPLEVNWTCNTHVEASDPYTGLLVSYIDLNTDYSERCRKNGLYIFDSNGLILNSPHGDCGTDPPKDKYWSSGHNLTFVFHTDESKQTGNFDLLITPVTFPTENGSCPGESFLCRNRRCVSEIVTCNGFNDCGDNSDEIDNCSNAPTLIVVGIAAVLVVSVVISLILFVIQYRRRKYSRLSHKDSHHSRDYHHNHGYQTYEH